MSAQAIDVPRPRRRSLFGDFLELPHTFRHLVLAPTALLSVIGLIMVWSASSVEGMNKWDDPYHFTFRQAVFFVIGLAFAAVLYLVFTKAKEQTVIVLGWIFFLATLALEAATLIPGIGHSMNGNQNWIRIGVGDLGIQPAEFGKLALMWWGACIFAAKAKAAESKLLDKPFQLLFPFLLGGVLLTGIVVWQDDLGTGVVLLLITLLMLFNVGLPLRVLGLIAALGAIPVTYLIIQSPNRIGRIFGFLDTSANTSGINYQHTAAQLAFARGGWFGVGLNASRQKWLGLPEAHTDYILSVVGEELGLVCVLLIVALFGVLGFAGWQIAMRSDIPLYRYAAGGITGWLMFAALVNMAVVLGLFPVFGVPLPFLSSGGSALVSVLGGCGILLACAYQLPAARAYREAQAKSPKVTLYEA